MVSHFKLRAEDISSKGSSLLLRSKLKNGERACIVWAPKEFTLERSFFSIQSDVTKTGGYYLYTDEVDTYFLCALLNSAPFKRSIFGANLRPFGTYHLDVERLLAIDFLKVESNERDFSLAELFIQFLHEKDLSDYQKSVREYMISQFEDVRDAMFLELVYPLFFSNNALSIRKHWSSALEKYSDADNMLKSIEALFQMLNENSDKLSNDIKRLRMLLNILPRR